MTQRLAPDAAAVARFREDLARVWVRGPGERLLVAVSGGPDSIALLLLAHAALADDCVAATVDHGLRRESAAEAAFVAALCRDMGVPHAVLSGELPARAGRTANLSARARTLRYRLLEAHLQEIGAARLATAHHADDQLETLVMRLNRGAGVAGLAGVRAHGGRIVRPLLGWRHVELDRLVAECGIAAVSDPTNVDDRFDRARLRKVLSTAGWLDAAMWGRSAAALCEAEEALGWAARRYLDDHAMVLGGGELLLQPPLEPPPREIARRVFALALARVDPACAPTGAELARLVDAMLASDPPRIGEGGERCCATLGRVRVEAERDGADARRFRFSRVLPPRGH